MAYRLKTSDGSPQAALRRIAMEEIDGGLAELDNPGMNLPTRCTSCASGRNGCAA